MVRQIRVWQHELHQLLILTWQDIEATLLLQEVNMVGALIQQHTARLLIVLHCRFLFYCFISVRFSLYVIDKRYVTEMYIIEL
jgi:hypothetical protein